MGWSNQAWDWVCEGASPPGSFNVPRGLVSFRRTMIIDDETMMTMTCDLIQEFPCWSILTPKSQDVLSLSLGCFGDSLSFSGSFLKWTLSHLIIIQKMILFFKQWELFFEDPWKRDICFCSLAKIMRWLLVWRWVVSAVGVPSFLSFRGRRGCQVVRAVGRFDTFMTRDIYHPTPLPSFSTTQTPTKTLLKTFEGVSLRDLQK